MNEHHVTLFLCPIYSYQYSMQAVMLSLADNGRQLVNDSQQTKSGQFPQDIDHCK